MGASVIAIDVSPLAAPRTGVGVYVAGLAAALAVEPEGLDFVAASAGRVRPVLPEACASWPRRHWPLPARAVMALQRRAGWPRAEDIAGRVEVWHATNYALPPARRARRILTIYDLAMLRNPAWADPRTTAPFQRGLPRRAREADAVVACSEATRLDVHELLHVPLERIVVAPAALDPAFRPMPRNAARAHIAARHAIDGPYMLFVGTIEPRKNVPALVRAFAAIAHAVPHALVLAGGAGSDLPQVQATVARCGLEGRVRHLGYLPDPADLPALYAAADVFAFPSHCEGFGLPLLEAMASDCPIVAANNSAIPEVAGDAACLVPNDEATLAAALLGVLEDSARAGGLRARGRERLARFSWPAAAARMRALYRLLT